MKKKRSLDSPVGVEMELNSPNQMKPMLRELHTFEQDSEYEHHYQPRVNKSTHVKRPKIKI